MSIKEYNYSPIQLEMVKIHEDNTKVIEPDHRIVKAGRTKKGKDNRVWC